MGLKRSKHQPPNHRENPVFQTNQKTRSIGIWSLGLLWSLGPGAWNLPAQSLGDSIIRARAGKSEIVITTTARLAGAIHSLKWDGKEFIDSTDHGRQLQSACSFDNSTTAPPETFNPTEAGSRLDGPGPTSTSQLVEFEVEGNRLRTKCRLAFWLAPGEKSDGYLARNTNALSRYLLTKTVDIGIGKYPQMLYYRTDFVLPPEVRHVAAQFEALTGYMPEEFTNFWQFNLQSGKLESLDDGPGEIQNPIVFATADGRHAMGIYGMQLARRIQADPSFNQTGPSYGRWRFKAEKVVKWNCVYRVRDPNGIPTGTYWHPMLVPIGTLSDVEAMLREQWTEMRRK
jgi:hypothetical protein